ncbi:MAG: single-stranded-DNA-specific exonuclease RecJ, partial [Pseudomonadota bacterium]|nr:single-stranded-DNA-specific exonuclease RecJ [Pseudomonadota bacterium]
MAAAGHAAIPFLGVSQSLSGRLWRERPADGVQTRHHQARHGLSEPLARALASRGIDSESSEAFLRPSLKALFPDPSSFADMDRAASLLVDALQADRSMVVFADYDVDGAASAAQLVRWFRHMGKELPIYVPDRLSEGYGPSPAAFRRIRAGGAELVITVDCGAVAYDAVATAGEIGLDVVVIDHHLMRQKPLETAALVNPNRPDCNSGQGMLAVAGVTFVLLAALNREARTRRLFGPRGEPDLRQWLDLVAMGAICDVTQLVGFNRALAVQGLKVMSQWANPGLAALMAVAGAQRGQASMFQAGFILGPRINAGGRIGRSDLGARLLSTDNAAEATELARELDDLNARRKDVEREIITAAILTIEHDSNYDSGSPAIVIAQEGWHPGVIGIVASRLRERYRKPVVVIGVDLGANIGKGSGRSQEGVNLGAAIQAAFDEGLLLTGGGHAMAAGLTLRPSSIPEFRTYLCERLAGEMTEASERDALDIDAVVSPGAARALLKEFEILAPFGPGNPEVRVALANVRVESPMTLRGGHIRCNLVDLSGASVRAVAWRLAD